MLWEQLQVLSSDTTSCRRKDKGRQAETSVGFWQYGGGAWKWEPAERRSDLKEEASDLEQQVVAAKTQESARERESGKK
jgi:hypothetical protein